VAVGTELGHPLIIGMKFAGVGPVNDSLTIGVEAVGFLGSNRLMSIAFAPFSGSCFIEHEGVTIQAKVLPSIPEASECRAWIHVTEKGGIRFLRQFKDGQIEDTGLMPPEMFPDWIQSYFGCVDIWLSDLAGAVDFSVEYSGCAFPIDMPICHKRWKELKTTWSILGQDGEWHDLCSCGIDQSRVARLM
jgi:hypothetical protein